MPINQKMLAALIAANQESGAKIAAETMAAKGRGDQEAALRKYLQAQEPEIAQQKQAAQNEENLKTLNDPRLQDLVNDGGSVKAGDLSIGGNPYARLFAQGPHQAQAFLKTAQGAYQPINEQLDSTKATLDYLNQGNASSDKLALINEARLAASTGGSRALGAIIPLLSGDKTMGSDLQKGINWLQNTPNIPTMTPAMRDSLRESAFNRLDQLGQLKDQADAQLAQQGPVIAPYADTGTLIKSLSTPASQKLQALQKMRQDYAAQRQAMGPQPAVSQNAQANPNPSTFDRLKALFGLGGGAPSQPAQAPAQGPGLAPQAGGKVKVRRKSDGATGTMDSSDPALQSGNYEVVQ